uniref:UDP-N-acetylglucosamine transferase subunit ALG14 n=1 Tax=Setaria digitata TaxID=48799 RepID=A0A915PR32_9BILA
MSQEVLLIFYLISAGIGHLVCLMADGTSQGERKKFKNQLQQHGPTNQENAINIGVTSMGKTEVTKPTVHASLIPVLFQETPVVSFLTTPNNTPSYRENTFLSTAKLVKRSKRKQKGGGNGLMMIAILHLLLACGLIDLGMFLSIRFSHYGHIWPDSYAKLSVSEYRLYRNQILSIRLLYSPVTITVGLMIFFPKIIYLLSIFSSEVSFYRTVIVDGVISFVALIYACITGTHAYILLNSISKIEIDHRTDILCYAIRGPREKAPQELRDQCLLVAYKMFGDHLSLESIIAILVIIFSNLEWYRAKKSRDRKLGCSIVKRPLPGHSWPEKGGRDFGVFSDVLGDGDMSEQLLWLILIPLLVFILLYLNYIKRHACPRSSCLSASTRICSVLGSGGHTAELLSIMSAFKDQFGYRVYVVADTDQLSEQRVMDFEKPENLRNFRVVRMSRSREVKQSYITSIFTTVWACVECLLLMWRIRPDIVLCNGPGVCLPICFASALFDLLRLRNIRLFYVESLCRVKKLSLTGQILYQTRIPDIFFVHWQDLVERYPRAVLVPCIT